MSTPSGDEDADARAAAGAPRVADPGLQLERTQLSWRRTGLSSAVAAAAAVRLGLPALGALAVLLGAVGLALSLLTVLLAQRRYRRAHRALLDRGALDQDGAAPALATAAVLTVGAVTALLLVDQELGH